MIDLHGPNVLMPISVVHIFDPPPDGRKTHLGAHTRTPNNNLREELIGNLLIRFQWLSWLGASTSARNKDAGFQSPRQWETHKSKTMERAACGMIC